MYLQTILKRPDDEITKKIYECQKYNPVKGDWVEMVKKDFSNVEMAMNEEVIKIERKTINKYR